MDNLRNLININDDQSHHHRHYQNNAANNNIQNQHASQQHHLQLNQQFQNNLRLRQQQQQHYSEIQCLLAKRREKRLIEKTNKLFQSKSLFAFFKYNNQRIAANSVGQDQQFKSSINQRTNKSSQQTSTPPERNYNLLVDYEDLDYYAIKSAS